MSEKTYEMDKLVEYAYCDCNGEGRLSYLLAIAQQASMEHCDHAGIGGDFLFNRGLVFLLAKLRLDIPRTPKGGERIAIFTKPNLPVRAQYRRCTDFSTMDGELCCHMDSRWVLVDIASRHMLRRLPEGIDLPFLEAEELTDFRPTPLGDLTLWDEVTVRYSMMDINKHMNNTVYGDIITNLLESRLLAGERICSVEISYHREALHGDRLQLWCGEDGNSFFVRGKIGDVVCFEAAVKLEKV